ncbi:MAG: hypothetical protein Kow0037_05900 [Calditrichia bacterium]
MKVYYLFLMLGLLAFSSPVFSQKIHETLPVVPPGGLSPPDPLFDSVVSRGIELTFNDHYEESLALFDSLVQIYPDHPAPYFFRAASFQNLMNTYRINIYQNQLESNVQAAIETGEKQLKNSNDPWLNFYVGAAYGYRGFNKFRKHNWIGAYKDGKRGISNFKKALEKDTTMYDVYLGLGSYFYWRTAKSKFIKIIAFWMKDKRELGLRQLLFAEEHGRYAANEAAYVLLSALFDSERYDEAQTVLERLIARKEIPANTDLYYQGRLAIQSDNWPVVEESFSQLFSRLKSYPRQSFSYLAECRYWQAYARYRQNRISEAAQLIAEADRLFEKYNPDREMEGLLEKNKDIGKAIEKLKKAIGERKAD